MQALLERFFYLSLLPDSLRKIYEMPMPMIGDSLQFPVAQVIPVQCPLSWENDPVFSRDQLLDKIWGNINVELRTVDVHIRRLRKNININNTKDLIRTVRSSGYSLDIVK